MTNWTVNDDFESYPDGTVPSGYRWLVKANPNLDRITNIPTVSAGTVIWSNTYSSGTLLYDEQYMFISNWSIPLFTDTPGVTAFEFSLTVSGADVWSTTDQVNSYGSQFYFGFNTDNIADWPGIGTYIGVAARGFTPSVLYAKRTIGGVQYDAIELDTPGSSASHFPLVLKIRKEINPDNSSQFRKGCTYYNRVTEQWDAPGTPDANGWAWASYESDDVLYPFFIFSQDPEVSYLNCEMENVQVDDFIMTEGEIPSGYGPSSSSSSTSSSSSVSSSSSSSSESSSSSSSSSSLSSSSSSSSTSFSSSSTSTTERIHFWHYVLNEGGQPIQNAEIRLYLQNAPTTEADIYTTPTVISSTTCSEAGIKTDNDGFFEFWLEGEGGSGGYAHTTEFILEWFKAGIAPGYVYNYNPWPNALVWRDVNVGADVTYENKFISNYLVNKWFDHANAIVPSGGTALVSYDAPHDLHKVDYESGCDDNTYNKVVSNKFIYDILKGCEFGDTYNLNKIYDGVKEYHELVSSWSTSGNLYYKDITHADVTGDTVVRMVKTTGYEEIVPAVVQRLTSTLTRVAIDVSAGYDEIYVTIQGSEV